jgi:serine/threonine protein phosphatase PrpC
MSSLALECTVHSDVGRRANNEDAAFASDRLAAVADGVGGAVAGEIASRTVINALIGLDKSRLHGELEDELREAVGWGNDTLAFITACHAELSGMSTTLTAVALTDDGRYLVTNVGDSRCYLYRQDRLSRLTRDDSFVQALIDRGQLTPVQARRHPQRSVVIEALDGRPRSGFPLSSLKALTGDRLLLCSDGLSDVVEDELIAATLRFGSRGDCVRRLIELALESGGRDNVTAVVADVVSRPEASPGWLPVID